MEGEKRQPCAEETKRKIGIANGGEKNGMYGKSAWNSNSKGLTKRNSGSFKKGHVSWIKGKEGIHFSPQSEFKKGIHYNSETKFKKGFIPWNKNKRYSNLKVRGKNSWNWKDGITPIRIIIWKCFKSVTWRLSIYERDKFLCQMPDCDKTERFLNAHHIKEFSKILKENNIKTLEGAENCKELWDINNGITLCKKCHQKIRGKENDYVPLLREIIKLKNI
jgi:hypothetical protein